MTSKAKKMSEDPLVCPEGFQRVRFKGYTAYLRQDVTEQQLELLLTHDAEVLKETPKCRVRAVGHWVIKERCTGLARAVFSPTGNRNRHMSSWRAGNHLRAHGVRVPEPLAYVERGTVGLVTRSWHILQNLIQCRDVESFVSEMIHAGADGNTFSAFLHHLACAINALSASGAYHGDLSGKNIYTRDGVRFFFIDLDAVELNAEYTEEKRLRNHVQLYDSFCDALTDTLLVPFIEALLPDTLDLRIWMPKVRSTQEKRRAKVEAHWAKYGQPEHVNPLRAFRTHL